MEKYGQYRDKGSGIAPFFPVPPTPSNNLLGCYHVFLFFFRLPFFIFAWAIWTFIVQWTGAGGALRKANLWCILGLPGVWWIDIRVDGVARGSLGIKSGRLPYPGTVIASSYTSPLDVLYLAAIFDPIFTQSYPDSGKVLRISFERALAACFAFPPTHEDPAAEDLAALVARNPTRVIVVFPECTTSNGRGVLHLSPSLLVLGKKTPVFPVSLRYTPADVVTPIPGWMEAARFAWRLGSRQSHSIRVRVGFPLRMRAQDGNAAVSSPPPASPQLQQQQQLGLLSSSGSDDRESEEDLSLAPTSRGRKTSAARVRLQRNGASSSGTPTPNTPPIQHTQGYDTNFFDSFEKTGSTTPKSSNGVHLFDDDEDEQSSSVDGLRLSAADRKALDAVAESLSRLGRVKTLGLGVPEKQKFVEAWLRKGPTGKKLR